MSSAAPAAAAAVAAPVLAPMSPFLASRPLAAAYGALPPTGSPIGSDSSADPSASIEFAAPPPHGVATQPPYGVVMQPPYGVAPTSYGASSVAQGSLQPPPSSWPVASYAAPPHHQPHAVPLQHHYGLPPAQTYLALPPQQSYLAPPQQPCAALPRQSYPAPSGFAAAPLQLSYGAAANYGADALVSGPPGIYSAGASHPETAPSMGLYAPPMHAHAAQGAAPSPFYFSHLLPVKLVPDNYLS
nr:protein tfg-1-like [Aegilops tauschii subsp. strangulata]